VGPERLGEGDESIAQRAFAAWEEAVRSIVLSVTIESMCLCHDEGPCDRSVNGLIDFSSGAQHSYTHSNAG
jgi:hypothetical protein